jgi:opacity protein-like surface antigen
MSNRKSSKIILFIGVILALAALATTADAQVRGGQWEFTIGPSYQLSTSMTGDEGSKVDTGNDWGLVTSLGYHFSDRLSASFGLGWSSTDYDAVVKKEGGGTTSISGSYDSWATTLGLNLYLSEGPLVPYLGAGIGWTWIDTNIPSGLPSTGCWWDPWYGYVCYTTYPTKGTDGFSYQATAGLRYEYSPSGFVRFAYTAQWLNLDHVSPRFDVFTLDFGWLF